MHMDGGAVEMTWYNYTQQINSIWEFKCFIIAISFFFVSDQEFRTFIGETCRWRHSPMLTHHVQAAVIALKAQVEDVQ